MPQYEPGDCRDMGLSLRVRPHLSFIVGLRRVGTWQLGALRQL